MSYKSFFLSLIVFFGINSFSIINRELILREKRSFVKYLENLSWKMAAPLRVINVTAAAMGLSEVEIDAIPISFPFIYEEKYKQQLHKLDSEITINAINYLLDCFNKRSSGLSKRNKEALIHTIIHEFVLEHLKLPKTTTTKELAQLVATNRIDIAYLCELQLAAFFVKFHINL